MLHHARNHARRSLALALTALLATTLGPAPGATATATGSWHHRHPRIIPLPDDWQPEGIAVSGHRFYAGSLVDGDIYRGSLHTGRGRVFIDVSGRQAAGLKVDRRHKLLFVAGAFTGRAYVYDLRTGATVADIPLGTFLNDVVVRPRAAYFTESTAPRIYRVPIRPDGSLSTPQTIDVTGPAAAPIQSFGLNGIDATPDGRRLIVAHTELGKLFTVNRWTGASREIRIVKGSLVTGTLDGILRVGRTIWVVQNFANRVSKVRVGPHWRRGVVTASVGRPAFHVPTTIARHRRWLVVVNAKFDLSPPPPGTPYEVVQFRAP